MHDLDGQPIGAKTADFFIRVLDGRDTASLEQLHEWRDEMRPMLEALKKRDNIQAATENLQDAYRARLREAYLRARERIELVAHDLERRIQAQETAG